MTKKDGSDTISHPKHNSMRARPGAISTRPLHRGNLCLRRALNCLFQFIHGPFYPTSFCPSQLSICWHGVKLNASWARSLSATDQRFFLLEAPFVPDATWIASLWVTRLVISDPHIFLPVGRFSAFALNWQHREKPPGNWPVYLARMLRFQPSFQLPSLFHWARAARVPPKATPHASNVLSRRRPTNHLKPSPHFAKLIYQAAGFQAQPTPVNTFHSSCLGSLGLSVYETCSGQRQHHLMHPCQLAHLPANNSRLITSQNTQGAPRNAKQPVKA